MKKIVSFVLLSLLLVSCKSAFSSDLITAPITSDSSNSSNNSSTNSSSLLNEEERIVAALKNIKNTSNYTISYQYQDQNYTSYYTNDYVYYSETNLGYINLESYDTSLGETIVYNYYFDSQNNFTLAYAHEDKIASCQSFNYIANLKAIPSTLKQDNDHYYSDNKNLINSLANTLGYYEDAENGTFTRVKLSSDKDNSFTFTLQTIDYDSFEYVDVVDASGTIFDIGQTSLSECDKYLKSFKLPTLSLSETKIANLNLIDENDILSIDSKAYIAYTDGQRVLSDSLSYDRSLSRVKITDEDGEQYYQNQDGKVIKEGIDALNIVSTMPLGEYYIFDQEYPLSYETLLKELSAFRLVDEQKGQYQYFGFNGEEIYKNFSYIDVNSAPESIYLTATDNDLTLTATFPEMGMQSGNTIQYFKIQIVSTLVSDRKIPVLTPLEESNSELQPKIDALNGTHNFIANAYDTRTNEREKNTYLIDNLLIFEQKELTFSGTVSSYITGYKKESDGIQRFLIDKDGIAKKNGQIKSDVSLSDYVGMNVSPSIFNKTDDMTYELDPLVLKTVSDSLILGNESDNLVTDSLKMKVDGKHITQITYDYDDGLFQQGSEIVNYSYENLKIPQDILTKIDQMPDFIEPVSWKDESVEIYEKLVDLFGEAIADTIPYIYDEETYCQFESTYLYDMITISSSSETVDDDKFYTAYKELLVSQGYELDLTPDLPGAEIYTKGNVEIRLAKDLTGGIFISKLA